MRLLLLAAVVWTSLSSSAWSHALDPGYLSLDRLEGHTWRVFWSKPDVQGQPMQIDAVLPATCKPFAAPAPRSDGRAWISSWLLECPQGIGGGTISIRGLEATQTDVLVRWDGENAGAQRLTPSSPTFKVPSDLDWSETVFVFEAECSVHKYCL